MRHAGVLAEERPFRGFALFWEGMAAPLLLLAKDPSRARLARLAIADQPLQGPRFADGEPPLSVAALVGDLKQQLLSACEGLAPDAALRRTAQFMSEHASSALAQPAAPGELEAKLVGHVASVLAGQRCSSVACIAADAYFGAGAALSGRDVLVVEPSTAKAQMIDAAIAQGMAARSVALWMEHPLNRLFRREAARADAVFAVDPLRGLAHPSGAEHANIAELLDGAAGRAVVLAAPHEQRAKTRRMLEERFGSVRLEHFGWPYGGWDVMVCTKG
jgi:hypothetical protein